MNTVAQDTPQLFVSVSDTDIVSDEWQSVLIYWRDTFRVGQFNIGDIANKIIQESRQKGLPVTQQRIYDAVGRFCGKSGRTVRYYAETAAFFGDDVRATYEVLPFSHFVFARTMGNVQDALAVLEYAAEHPNTTAEGLRYRFTFAGADEGFIVPETEQTADSDADGGYDSVSGKVVHDSDRSVYLREKAKSNISTIIAGFDGLVDLGKELYWTTERLERLEEYSQRVRALLLEFAEDL